MSCERAGPLLYDLIDREIGRDEAVWLAEHLASCPACAARLVQMRRAEELYARQMPVEPAADLAGRVAQAVWARREAPVAARRDAAAVSLFLLALAAAGVILAPGAADALWGWASRIRELAEARPEAALPGLLERFTQMWRALADSLPPPPGGAWAPLAAAAVALQILGSAWLLSRGGRAQQREEAG